MDGGSGAPLACIGAVVIRRWLVVASSRCPDGRIGAYVASSERIGSNAPLPVPGMPSGGTEDLWSDATRFTSETFDTGEISDLEAFLEAMAELERVGATILDAEAWQAIKKAAARRIIRLQSEQAFTD
ncbi:hypothetical protein DF3PB_660004 [uncultured Defluviicoccus sp.]|uniref:Uncharacterized protein n=1 Tax=metagenome TaxID=256318 RepID=A0A380TJA4_9ZZZZ|nr:hypothetical protein DF3PB_660004 [uncultured Defluviicoccus sp.]